MLRGIKSVVNDVALPSVQPVGPTNADCSRSLKAVKFNMDFEIGPGFTDVEPGNSDSLVPRTVPAAPAAAPAGVLGQQV
jgi:hypothetical protein